MQEHIPWDWLHGALSGSGYLDVGKQLCPGLVRKLESAEKENPKEWVNHPKK